MRHAIKLTLVLAICVAFLVPEAWGRPRDYGEANPWSDGVGETIAASAPSQVLLFHWQQGWPMSLPFIFVIKVRATVSPTKIETERAELRKSVQSKKRGRG